MNAWEELRKKQQKEVNVFPIHFAFGSEQFDALLKELHIRKREAKKELVSIGNGGFVRKSDYLDMMKMFDRHKAERDAAIATDKTGDGVIFDMLYTELKNHEYGYTMDADETLEDLGISQEMLLSDVRYRHALDKATAAIRKEEGFSW